MGLSSSTRCSSLSRFDTETLTQEYNSEGLALLNADFVTLPHTSPATKWPTAEVERPIWPAEGEQPVLRSRPLTPLLSPTLRLSGSGASFTMRWPPA